MAGDAGAGGAPPAGQGRALREVGALMLRLGLTAFGGPAAHLAMLEKEVVQRRRWLTPAAFLDLLGATNLIPGPNSTQMMIHIGMRRAGLSREQIDAVRQAYHIIFRQHQVLPVALAQVEQELGNFDTVLELVKFIRESKRGINPARDRDSGGDIAA